MGGLSALPRLFIRKVPRRTIFCNKVVSSIIDSKWNFTFIRSKYTKNIGVKGITNRKMPVLKNITNIEKDTDENTEDELNLEDAAYDEIVGTTMHVTNDIRHEQNVFVIQPYVKWGPNMSKTSPELQLEEAEALIRSIPRWNVAESLKVPLESIEKRVIFGSGKMDELKSIIKDKYQQGNRLNSIFISKGTLSTGQKRYLESELGIPVMDRYTVVIQILRLHATSTESKLQVALAELPYIWSQMKDASREVTRKQTYALSDSQKELLRTREKKLKQELENVRMHRKLLRHKRKQMNFPVVAVVGYTNAGKTSLIKALTDEAKLQPRNQLFATLDVTAHAGLLPCNLEVIYMDTVGFLSDIPTGLIECFVATLEDAMLADVIIHVQDLAHENIEEQRKHVEKTLKMLTQSSEESNEPIIINVGNKVDLIKSTEISETQNIRLVSSKTHAGLHDLMLEIEAKVLQATNRVKIIFRVNSGSEEMAWLYKNSAVTDISADPDNAQNMLVSVVISNAKLQQFRHILKLSNK